MGGAVGELLVSFEVAASTELYWAAESCVQPLSLSSFSHRFPEPVGLDSSGVPADRHCKSSIVITSATKIP